MQGVSELQKRVEELELKEKAKQKNIALLEAELRSMSSTSSPDDVIMLDVNGWPAAKIRQTFVEFFQAKEHTNWPSSPVVPHEDPTLMFANAGMNQFKPLFLGTADPNLPLSKLKRAVNSQKCIRAGGKHNDLDDVGKDVYHHTFFEMLGNWSFGDYFKKEAITWAWECLTVTFGLNPDRLYATYFGGDKQQGLAPDEEAKAMWLQFLPQERVLPFGCKDNFWEMGDTGPCGPCTEIHYDRIGNRDASKLVNADVPDCIEIWNNVFIQFNREAGGELKELPSKHVDTGMGFERLASILQGKMSNYDTDVFVPIFGAIQTITGAKPYAGKVGAEDTDTFDMAYRVVADHIRTLTFAITDGAVPSNDGRGYVLRRILRRGVRYGQQILGAKPGFFHQLVPVVVEMLKGAFPELDTKVAFVMDVLKEEEMNFNKTLEKGLREFGKKVAEVKGRGEKLFPGADTFLLYSSHGFPVDLTQLMAEEMGLNVDMVGFEAKMEEDKQKSMTAELARRAAGGKSLTMEAEQTAALAAKSIPATDQEGKYVWHHQPAAKIVALYGGKGQGSDGDGLIETATKGDVVGVILDATPYYAEQGGQVYDTGVLFSDDASGVVSNVQTYAGYVLHTCTITEGTFTVGSSITAAVDYERRSLVAPNHTMTHVLNYALRKVLCGDGANVAVGLCDQKGSFVDDEKLRFDFAWTGGLTPIQLEEVEAIVNETIKAKLPVHATVAPLEKALKISALRQVFGERYPDPVRVLSVGQEVAAMLENPEDPAWSGYSIEFCGGTHLTNTGDAGSFVLLEEAGTAKGIRRITAVTRNKAIEARAKSNEIAGILEEASKLDGLELDKDLKRLLPLVDTAAISAVDKSRYRQTLADLTTRVIAFKKKLSVIKAAQAKEIGTKAAEAAKAAGSPVVVFELEAGSDNKQLQSAMDEAFSAYPEAKGVMVFAKGDQGTDKYSCTAVCPKGSDAKSWMAGALSDIGGKANGKPERPIGLGAGADNVAHAMEVALQTSP